MQALQPNIEDQVLPSPGELKSLLPTTLKIDRTVRAARRGIIDILDRKDSRLVMIVGPCSIHDPVAALEYAERLKKLMGSVSDTLLILMRTYLEKPRTTLGWKGFVNDPQLDDSRDIHEGLFLSRKLLREINEMGIPVATEILDAMVQPYVSDFVSWGSIGARTSESQTHRELASGIDFPIGFKNPMDGRIEVAVQGVISAMRSHHYLKVDSSGRCAVARSRGNHHCHVILRGGKEPNYSRAHIEVCEELHRTNGLAPRIFVDCSHGNSQKDHTRQAQVLADCRNQILDGNTSLFGFMLESNLRAGRQELKHPLEYGVSITDACLDWETTESLLRDLAHSLRKRQKDAVTIS